MQAHALALAARGDVTLVGLQGSPVQQALTAEPRVRSLRLRGRTLADGATDRHRGHLAFSGARRALQGIRLGMMLMRGPKPDLVLMQNPPSTPTMAVVWIVARLRGARLAIDWQNLSHARAAVTLGEGHRTVRALQRGERRWARRADAHIAASRAMADWLQRECGVDATVFHDSPTACFRRPDLAAASAMWQRLSRELSLPPRRVALVVCSTSWQPDEDFDLLLEALERTERRLVEARGPGEAVAPDLLMLMTGRGPLQREFEVRVERRALRRIAVRTMWLEPADYPIVVGMADAGVCLHQSASGRDLPTRLAEFRGCGVPLCVYDYAPVVAEVLTDGREGVTFRDAGELSNVLTGLAAGDVSQAPAVASARKWLATHPVERWDAAWERVVAPVLRA